MNFINCFLFLLFINYVKAQPTRTTRLASFSKTATSSTCTTTESGSSYTVESANTSTVSKTRTRSSTNLNRLTTRLRALLTKRPSQTLVYTRLNINNLISVQITNVSESNITSIAGEVEKNVLDLFYEYCLII